MHADRALLRVNEAVDLSQQCALADLKCHGLIQAYTLTWKTRKYFFSEQGVLNVCESHDITREAFTHGLILTEQL